MSGFHYTREAGPAGQILVAEGSGTGLPLDRLLDRGRPAVRVALEIGATVADIQCIALEDKAVHGDLRPAHVRVATDGAVSVEGYGILRRVTRAPEGRPDQASADVYGLGLLIYTMLANEPIGSPPRDAAGHDEHIRRRVDVIPLGQLSSRKWAPDLRAFLCKLLSFKTEDRPQPLDAANVFASIAVQCPGEDVTSWVASRASGGVERLSTDPADDVMGTAVTVTGFYPNAGGPRKAPSAKGESTTFWTKERIQVTFEPSTPRGTALTPGQTVIPELDDSPSMPRMPSAPGRLTPTEAARASASPSSSSRMLTAARTVVPDDDDDLPQSPTERRSSGNAERSPRLALVPPPPAPVAAKAAPALAVAAPATVQGPAAVVTAPPAVVPAPPALVPTSPAVAEVAPPAPSPPPSAAPSAAAPRSASAPPPVGARLGKGTGEPAPGERARPSTPPIALVKAVQPVAAAEAAPPRPPPPRPKGPSIGAETMILPAPSSSPPREPSPTPMAAANSPKPTAPAPNATASPPSPKAAAPSATASAPKPPSVGPSGASTTPRSPTAKPPGGPPPKKGGGGGLAVAAGALLLIFLVCSGIAAAGVGGWYWYSSGSMGEFSDTLPTLDTPEPLAPGSETPPGDAVADATNTAADATNTAADATNTAADATNTAADGTNSAADGANGTTGGTPADASATAPATTATPTTATTATKPTTSTAATTTTTSTTKPATTTTAATTTTSKPATTTTAPATTTTTTSKPATTTSTTKPAAAGAYKVRFLLRGRDGELQCGDGQTSHFVGNTALTFDGTVTCLVKSADAKGTVQLDHAATATCTVTGTKVSCSVE